ncbi:Tom37 C-terminal domain-containing protein [Podospora didyma]|uniref:Tom37 C-terminal domain-containing protein n=1 Tax=Podospora didyma TaxID=330526 RepID=A0AAE0U801_9PEZI|nr:Tom37 C-terminal domain-containing protein [Podospora didyma]
MVLELHVWGPAFGLPSIDAECLAAIAYLARTTSRSEYRLVQTSPSAVPTHHLPALHKPSANTWISGFSPIISHLRSFPSPSFHDDSPPHHGDSTAYSAFLTAHAAPLIALSLYVSSANYAATTRPAYSAILPFPLPWTEPPAIRASMSLRAAHLGLSSLDTDAAEDASIAEEKAAAAAGWVHIPASLSAQLKSKSVKDALTPEQAARIKLDGLAREVLDVLAEADWDRMVLSARCLAYGYLALMAVPDVPRPWLREVLLQGGYPSLCELVGRFRGPEALAAEKLPWEESAAHSGQSSLVAGLNVGARFAQGLIYDIPGIGEEWRRWWARRRKRSVRRPEDTAGLTQKRRDMSASGADTLLVAGVGMAAVLAVNAGFFLYRSGVPSFGAPVHSWQMVRAGLSSFGAAGAMFSGLNA